jgi:hypothetical protein
MVGVAMSATSVVMLLGAFLHYRRRRARRLVEARERLTRAPIELVPGSCRLHGVAKKRRRGEDDVLAYGCNLSTMVTGHRSRFWKRQESRKEGRDFNLVLDDGARVRVRLSGKPWELETDAREHHSPERRVVEYQLVDGERLWVEGRLEPSVGTQRSGYRDRALRQHWRVVADETPLSLWTEGSLVAHESTSFMPLGVSFFAWGLAALMSCWSVAILTSRSESSAYLAWYVALSACLLGVAGAFVLAEGSGGWSGSLPWFQRRN